MAFKLDRLSAFFAMVKADRTASSAFITLWEKLCKKIEGQENSQDAVIAEQTAQQAQIVSILESMGYAFAAINSTQAATNSAAAAANNAQNTADGGAAVSGSATDPSVSLFGTSWQAGPVVNLTGVVAGNLTITGTGPIQDSDVTCSQKTFAGEYRVVEVIGGVDTVLQVFSFSAVAPDFDLATIVNSDASAVADFTSARASTGAVSYRIDARRVSGGVLADVSLYVYARRA